MRPQREEQLLDDNRCEIDLAALQRLEFDLLDTDRAIGRGCIATENEVELLPNALLEGCKAANAAGFDSRAEFADKGIVALGRNEPNLRGQRLDQTHALKRRICKRAVHLAGLELKPVGLALGRQDVDGDEKWAHGKSYLWGCERKACHYRRMFCSVKRFQRPPAARALVFPSLYTYTARPFSRRGRGRTPKETRMRLRFAALIVALAAAGWATAELNPEALRRKEAGNAYLKERLYEEARDQYLAALKAAPGYADAHYNLGVVYFFRLRDYPRALHHLVRYAELNPQASDMDQVQSLVFQALERIESSEREGYAKALSAGTPEALEAFVRSFPDSSLIAEAKEKLQALRSRDEESKQKEQEVQSAYEKALTTGTPEAMSAFLDRHPESSRAKEARVLRELWARQAEESKAFESALASHDAEQLQRFLAEHPTSSLAARARAELDRLAAADEAYKIAANSRSVPALEVFLATYSGTRRESEARSLLDTLRREESDRTAREKAEAEARQKAEADARQRAEAEAKEKAEAAARENAAAEARQKAEAEARAKDVSERRLRDETKRSWEETQRMDSREAYEQFLAAHPEGEEAQAARARMKELGRGNSEDEGQLPLYKKKSLEQYRRKLDTK